jgi:hypothetical protein
MPLSNKNKALMKTALNMQQPLETEISYTAHSVGTFFFISVQYGWNLLKLRLETMERKTN